VSELRFVEIPSNVIEVYVPFYIHCQACHVGRGMALPKYVGGMKKHFHFYVLLLLTGERKIKERIWGIGIFFLDVTFNNNLLKCKAYVQYGALADGP
jgi:hypothetical protein